MHGLWMHWGNEIFPKIFVMYIIGELLSWDLIYIVYMHLEC